MILGVKNLSRSFGGLVALSNVSLAIDEGETIELLGLNGSGKTTFFNVVTGFLKPDSGSVRFQNEDVTGLLSHAMSNRSRCILVSGREVGTMPP